MPNLNQQDRAETLKLAQRIVARVRQYGEFRDSEAAEDVAGIIAAARRQHGSALSKAREAISTDTCSGESSFARDANNAAKRHVGIIDAFVLEESGHGSAAQAVAVVCDTWELRWIGAEPIANIVNRHGLKIGDRLFAAPPVATQAAQAIHYPECWDTAAYPTVESALSEVYASFKCSECAPPVADTAKVKRYTNDGEGNMLENPEGVWCYYEDTIAALNGGSK